MNADKNRFFLSLRVSAFIGGFISLLFFVGCEKKREVVLYTSVDQPVAAPIIKEFEKQTGIHVILVTDTEATKSVGLAEKLRAEKDHPQADVWWGNEPFNTINLADEGILAPYESPEAKDIPDRYKDADHRWTSNGLRLRLYCYGMRPHTAYESKVERLEDLADPKKSDGTFAIARPTAGTTGGHIAAIYVLWGDEKADNFFAALRVRGTKLLGGNSVVAESVANGSVDCGLTDNDDLAAASEEEKNISVTMAFLDQDTFGTLAIPTTVGLVAGAPHSSDAKQLIDFLMTKRAEAEMITGKFAMGSVRPEVGFPGIASPVKTMSIDYHAVAKKMPDAVRRATAILEGRE